MPFNETFWPIAAKDHRCEWCGQRIDKGERHAHYTGIWECEFQNWRMHEECYAYVVINDGYLSEGFTPYEGDRPDKSILTPPPHCLTNPLDGRMR